MNIPSSKSQGYRIENYDPDFSSECDTDLEKDEEEESRNDDTMDDDPDSPSGRGCRRITSNGSFPGTPSWPQSYKASMDYKMLPASSGDRSSFSLFSPITRISQSYLSSSLKRPDILSTGSDELQIPFLPGKTEEAQQRVPGKPYDPKAESDFDLTYVPSKIVDTDKLREEYGITFMQASLNGLNVLAGVGTLSTPYGVMKGGWFGLCLLFFFALICLYTGILLRRCLESQPGAASFPDIGEAAFGPIGRLVIAIFLYAELYLCCVDFIVLEGENLAALFPGVTFDLAGLQMSPLNAFCIIAALLILPTVWLRDLSLLSYLSAGGVVATVLVTFLVFWVGTVDGVGFSHRGSLLNVAGIPVSVGLYGFCYSGHAVFPNIYSAMKRPGDFNKVLLLSFFLVTLIYSGIAVMGYTMFGDDLESSITLNLPGEFLASKLAVWTTVINPFTKFALSMTPVALSLEELLPGNADSFKNRTSSLAIRTALVASTVVVAIAIPFFGLIMAFIGALLSTTVSIIIPCACFLSIVGDKVTTGQRIGCWVIIVMGTVCALVGTYSSSAAIVANF